VQKIESATLLEVGHVIPDFALCRFRTNGSESHLGLVNDAKLYDLTALGKQEYATMSAWLFAASGQAEQALDELEAIASQTVAVATSEQLGANGEPCLLCPLDSQEVWACGVTYEMSREARMHESKEPTIYGRVYDADRPEIFFKAPPHRVVGPGAAVAVRADSSWSVPEPEMALVVTPGLEIIGYTIGNDMSSRDIEGQNPLYLPQAKIYDRCCSLGPLVRLARGFDPLDLDVDCAIYRDGKLAFEGHTHTSQIHRSLAGLVSYLGRCNSFPEGVFVLTGTGIVPPNSFTLQQGDRVDITFEGLGMLSNPVIELPVD